MLRIQACGKKTTKRSRIAFIYLFWMIFASRSSFRFSTTIWFGKTLDPGDVFHVGATVERQSVASLRVHEETERKAFLLKAIHQQNDI